MIAIDTNLLVYAHRVDSPFHKDTIDALLPVVEGSLGWGLPWQCAHEFTGIVTHPRIYNPPTPLNEALSFIEGLIASPRVHLLGESVGYFEKLREVALAANVSGARIHDARIAALCLHHGIDELWSADRDFSFFPQVRVRNPLIKN